jgi:ParB family chromosome partitioning protein
MRQSISDGNNDDNDSSINTLAQSIESQGLLNPILVRPLENNRYEVYAGHRRLLAVKQLKWDSISCLVSKISDSDAKIRSLIENYQRQNNTFEEKIRTFADIYHNSCGGDVKKLCQTVGSKPATVRRYLRLSELGSEVLKLLDGENRLTLKNADALFDLKTDDRQAVVAAIVDSKLSNFETECLIGLFKKNPDLARLPNYVNQSIEELARKRTKSVPKEKDASDSETGSSPRSSPRGRPDQASRDGSEADRSTPPSHSSSPNRNEPMTPLPGEEKVSRQKPWLYDPEDKLKRPHAIPLDRLGDFWTLYQS